MSNTIDERVVEMRFDNKQFESNVATSMSTLKELKKSLKFDGATKGLEDIGSAAGKVNMSGLGGAVDTVKAKFSAMDVVAITALTNITNKAINAGEQLLKSLSIDQITAGWQKFSDMTASSATLVAQGNAIEDVNAQLDRLLYFTDETSYEFTEMVSNIAKFTATGKSLKESVTAMEGIANWAALSGQNAQTASRAMYQLSQAMGAGVMRLEDYKSIQNASMDTEEFRQKCIDAAVSLGTLKDNGNGTYTSLVKGASDASFNISQFTTNLTEGMWLTSDVMMEVFNTYSSAVEAILDRADETDRLVSEVIDEIHDKAAELKTDTMSDTEAIDAAIRELGYTLDDGSLIFDSFGLKALEAAQKARTFSDAITSVKDAVSSQWMKTFQLLFGDAEKATELWTNVANQLWDIFASGGESRNDILEKTMVSGWDRLIERINDAGIETSDYEAAVKKCAEAGGENVDDLITKYGSLSKIFKEGALNTGYLKEALSNLNTDTPILGSLSEELESIGRSYLSLGSTGEDVEKLQTALVALGYTLDDYGTDGNFGSETIDALKKFQEAAGIKVDGIYGPETKAALNEASLRMAEISEESGDAEVAVDDLLDTIARPSGQELLFDSISNSLTAISKILGIFREAWSEIFTDDGTASALYNTLTSIKEATENFVASIEKNADKIKSAFKGIIAVIDIIVSIVGGAFKAVFEILGAIFGSTGSSVLDLTANIGDAIVKFHDWLTENELISKVFGVISSVITGVIGKVKEWLKALKESPVAVAIINGLNTALGWLNKAFDYAKTKVTEWLGAFDSSDAVTAIINGITVAVKWLVKAFNYVIPKVKEWFKAFKENPKVAATFNKIANYAKKAGDAVKGWVKAFVDTPFISKTLEAIKSAFNNINSVVSKGAAKVKQWFDAFVNLPIVAKAIETVSEAMTKVKEWYAAFKETPAVQAWIDAIDSLSAAISKLINGDIDFKEFGRQLVKGISAAVKSIPGIAAQIASDFIAGFQNGLSDSISGIIGGIVEAALNFVSSFAEALGVQSPSWKAYQIVTDFFQGAINAIGDALGPILAALKPIGEGIVKIFKSFWDYITDENGNVEWGKIIAGAITVESLLILKSFAEAMDKFASAATSFSGVISGATKVLSSISGAITKVGKAVSTDLKADALMKMAISIGILAASIWVLCQIDDYGKLWNSVAIIAVLAGVLIGLSVAMDKLNSASVKINKSGASLDGLKTGFLQIGIALLLVAAVVKIVSDIPIEQAKQGFIGLAGIAVGMVVFMAALGGISRYSKDVSGFGGVMLKIAVAMGIMVVVMKMASSMDTADIVVGLAVMEAFALLCIEIGVANRAAGAVNNGASFTKMAVAMGLMVVVMKLIATMDPADIIVGIAVMQAFVILLAEMAIVNRLAGNDVSKFGGTVAAMSFSMVLMAGVILLLSSMDESAVDKGIATMQKFVLLIAELIIVSKLAGKESAKIAGNLLAMSVSIGILAGIVILLGMCEDVDMGKGLAVVAGLGAIMAAMIWATRGASNCKANLITMTTAIAVMAAAVVALSFIDGSKLAGATAAIGSLMLIFGLMTKLTMGATASVGSLAVMVVVVSLLAAVIAGLCQVPNIDSALTVASSLSLLMVALAGSLALIAVVGPLATTAHTGIGVMLVVLVAVAAVIGVLCQIPNIDSALSVATALSELLLALSAACLLIAAGAAIMTVAGAGIGIMIGVIVAMGALMAAIAALVTWIPELETFLGKALPILRLIGQGIGEFLGGIVLGIGSAVLALLPALGAALSGFMVGVQPFVTLAGNVDASVIAGAGYLTAAILLLSAADFIAGIAQIGGLSFDELGRQLLVFGVGAMAFFTAIQGVDSSAIEAANNVSGMILALTASECISAIAEKFGGSTDFSSMNQNLQAFGEAVVGFSDTISGKIDTSAVEAATNAGLLLVELNKSLPRSGGLVQDVIGEQDFEKFAASCKAFAECILDINETISQEGFEVQSDKISQLATAGTQFSDLNNALPRSGGIAQDLAGEQDLQAFGIACVAFAACMIAVNQAVSSDDFVVQSDKISQLVTAGTQFNDLQTALPKSGGIAQDFAGEQDLETFGNSVSAFAECMIAVNTALSQEGFSVNLEGMEQLKQAGLKMEELQSVLPKSGGWWQSIAGSSDIGDFGDKINTFATAILDFSNNSKNLDTSGIDLAITTAYRLKTFIGAIKDIDYSGIADFTGVGTGGLGADGPLYKIAKAIAAFSDEVASIDTEKIPVAIRAAQQLRSFISTLSGLDTSGIKSFNPKPIGTAIKNYSNNVSGINFSAVNNSISVGYKLKNFISSLSGLNTSGVAGFNTALNSLAQANVKGVISTFSAASEQMSTIGTGMMTALSGGITGGMPAVTGAMNTVMKTVSNISKHKSKFKSAGKSLANALASGIRSGSSSASSAGSSVASSGASGARGQYNGMYLAGRYLADGLIAGINSKKKAVYDAAYKLGEKAVEGEKAGQASQSPSKATIKAGKWLGEGLVIGMKRIGGTVYSAGESMGQTAVNATRSAMTTILEALNGDIDAQPTIRPVVDLSDVQTGANAIHGMLNGVQTVGVRSNLNAISTTMNAKLQNGANDDIISAINKLGNGLENARGDTYNFGDFTYDDGSNVADAVGTLIRYAKIGRRV